MADLTWGWVLCDSLLSLRDFKGELDSIEDYTVSSLSDILDCLILNLLMSSLILRSSTKADSYLLRNGS